MSDRIPLEQNHMTSQTEPWTVLRLLEWTTNYLAAHGSSTARLDAEVLLAEARSCSRIDLYTAYDEVADERCRTAFRELVRRRADGTPVAYLVGQREFYSMSFRVTPDVLIPRPESELIIVKLLDLAKQYRSDQQQPLAVADVGTGSGILAVCAARHMANCRVTATDVSASALEVAAQNAKIHDVTDKVTFLQSDLLAGVPADHTFDFIVSNPPYVSANEYTQLSPEVREHEPREALLAGKTGTEVIFRLITEATPRLRSGGWLIVELSPMIAERVRTSLAGHDELTDIETLPDVAKLSRVAIARKV